MFIDDKKSNELKMLGDRMQAVRKLTSKKSKEVAEDLDLKPATVSAWENGKAEPPIRALMYWAEVFSCDLNWLILGKDAASIPSLVTEELASLRAEVAQLKDELLETLRRKDQMQDQLNELRGPRANASMSRTVASGVYDRSE